MKPMKKRPGSTATLAGTAPAQMQTAKADDKHMKTRMGLAAGLIIMALASTASANTIIGPGDVVTTSADGADRGIVVDLNAPQTLLAGSYTATNFNYEFSTLPHALPTAGAVTPLLLTSPSPGNYTVIAMGDTRTFTGDTAFAAHSFGGTSTFTLAADTTVYAGYYSIGDGFHNTQLAPIGFAGTGNSFFRYGADSPVVGNAISGGSGGVETRTYDFSITVIPEPSSFGMLGAAAMAMLRRRRS